MRIATPILAILTISAPKSSTIDKLILLQKVTVFWLGTGRIDASKVMFENVALISALTSSNGWSRL